MADSVFSLSKALSWLKSFLGSMSSPLSGFDIDDVKVKEEGGIFSSLFSFGANSEFGVFDKNGQEISDVGGNKINLSVLLSATNVKDALAPLFSGINKLSPEDLVKDDQDKLKENQLLDVLLGDDRKDNQYHEKNGKGLLGADLTKLTDTIIKTGDLTYDGQFWSWPDIAQRYLSYSLECQAAGKDYGAIENVTLSRCSALISEYLVKVDVITNADEVHVDEFTLVLPILIRIQAYLTEYFQAAVNKLANTEESDEGKPGFEDLTDKEAADSAEIPNAAEGTQMEGNTTPNNAMLSKHIDITLKKITGTSEIEMTAIKANYAPSEVVSDLDEIIWGQPDFLEVVPDELTTYSIDVDDDGFDIEPCEQCMEADPCASLYEVFKAGIRAYRNLYIIHWMSRGNDMMKLHVLAEEMYGELIQEIDTVGELLVEKQGTVPQLDFPCDYIAVQDYDFQGSLPVIQNLIQTYIDCIDYAYCNQDSDVQSTLDEWLRYWKKQLNYFVTRQEI